jgi:hypothetical protein
VSDLLDSSLKEICLLSNPSDITLFLTLSINNAVAL